MFRVATIVTLTCAFYPAHAAVPPDADPIDEVVVSATRAGDGIRRSLLGGSASVLAPLDLEQRQAHRVYVGRNRWGVIERAQVNTRADTGTEEPCPMLLDELSGAP